MTQAFEGKNTLARHRFSEYSISLVKRDFSDARTKSTICLRSKSHACMRFRRRIISHLLYSSISYLHISNRKP